MGLAAGAVVIAALAYVVGGERAGDAGASRPMVERVEEIAPELERYVERAMREQDVPAVAIGIVAEDELVYARGFGEGAQGRPVDAETMFEIGSATKSFLGATLALMVAAGRLDWDDRVVDHYGDFELADPWVTREFRVADLLAQRSGLAPYAADVLSLLGYDPDPSIAAVALLPAVSSFRSEFAYQNVPHQVASRIVAEQAGARDWNEAVGELLLEPLGMSSSGTSSRLLIESENSTRGHQVHEGRLREVAPVSLPERVYGAGSIISNVRDMARWIRFQLGRGEIDGRRILSAREHAATWRPQVAVTGEFAERMEQVPGATQLSYATGWFVHSVPEGRIVEHGGTTLGYTSAVRLDPDRQVGIVVLTNQAHAGGIANPVSKYAFDLLQGREPRDPLADAQPAAGGAPEGADEGGPGRDAEGGAADDSRAGEPEDAADALRAELVGTYRHPVAGRMRLIERDGELTTKLGPKRVTVRFEVEGPHALTASWHVDDREDGPIMSAPALVERDGRRLRALALADITFERL